MKGIILAGGFGTRLYPITKVTNKHLLPIYNKPMIYYPIEAMVKAGINRIIIITNPPHINDFVNLLGSGQDFKDKNGKQIQIVYGIQNKPSGIADGLWIAKDYIGTENCILILGDNIFWDDLTTHLKKFKDGAMIFLKEVGDPQRFGIAEIDENNNVISVAEKPKKPKSNLAITGIYVYDNTCFKKCIGQRASARGEYEITDINNLYLKEGKLRAIKLKKEWFDAGTIESLLETSNFVKSYHEKHSSTTKN
ncbi:MAG: Nucleotidyl transferase [Candidatus Berkelbacteria bacterium Licking1014_7]|uniref:glucose-1-phosphate thymidylyltransferase n=1 Tax=Candidatus Berkelbacteria bacterium Licking1014_7 TaxID=2017147 RepID=A0A554LJ38_9BACT|nr:MAG: Nucleotidyl transferase [Candidatus Berkelbacteria bacterium Licking1014_7]